MIFHGPTMKSEKFKNPNLLSNDALCHSHSICQVKEIELKMARGKQDATTMHTQNPNKMEITTPTRFQCNFARICSSHTTKTAGVCDKKRQHLQLIRNLKRNR